MMCDEPYMVIGLGNAYDFVIKNVNEPETYGTFQGDKKSIKEFIEKVNRIVKENEQLKMENNSLKLLVQNWEALDEEKDEQLDKQNQALKKLKKENEQLKQRNENQYNQLTELWGLIKRREWEILIEMDNKIKEDEERLQQEWKCHE